MSDFVESEAEESEEEYNQDGEVVPRVTKKFVEEDEDGEFAELSVLLFCSACCDSADGAIAVL